MPRLHTLYLPGNGEGMPFAFILDQANPMTEAAIAAWKGFAEKCGARDIIITAETIDIDPEISDGWQPDDDEPVDAPAGPCCGPRVITPLDLVSMVQAAHAAAWVPWEPANLDPESPQVMTHREEACPALNDGMTGCPMHAPELDGPWAAWPYFATPQGIITRICDHGITHPTPEEYLGGFDTPHLCDGCPCAPVADFSIVVSDLANTKLPRGTLLLGVKDDPTPVTAPPAGGWVNKPPQCNLVQFGGDNRCRRELGHDGECQFPPEFVAEDLADGDFRNVMRIQPLGADGEPVGEAKDYPLAGPVTITEGAGGETRNCFCGLPMGDCEHAGTPAQTGRTELVDTGWIAPPEKCVAGGEASRCTRPYGHEGLHEFGPFTRV